MIWKPSKTDAKIIRDYALKVHGLSRGKIEIGIRNNTEDQTVEPNANVQLVTKLDNDDWDDTDLEDKFEWAYFMKGVELTADGKGTFDFWVYSLGYHGELEGQVQAYIEPRAGGVSVLVRLESNSVEHLTKIL